MVKYSKVVRPFYEFADQQAYCHDIVSFEVVFVCTFQRSRTRIGECFRGACIIFFPFLGRGRIIADLMGLGKSRQSEPTTPATRKIVARAFAMYMWTETSAAEATGVQTTFEGKMRTCEALKVRARDIIFSSTHVARTTIRLGKVRTVASRP